MVSESWNGGVRLWGAALLEIPGSQQVDLPLTQAMGRETISVSSLKNGSLVSPRAQFGTRGVVPRGANAKAMAAWTRGLTKPVIGQVMTLSGVKY